MFTKKKLSKAITMTFAGAVLSVSAISTASAASTTMYNLTSNGGVDISSNITNPVSGSSWGLSGDTDGWLYGGNGSSAGTDTSTAKWAGTTGLNKTPFGYTGAHLNWAVSMDSHGTAEISTNDAFDNYGVYADIDTAKGAWSDNVSGNVGDAGGWRHDLEFGLFKSSVSGTVNLDVSGIIQSGTQFGFTIFKGMSTNSNYGHHGTWNVAHNEEGITASSLPGGGTTFTEADIVAYSVGDDTSVAGDTSSNLNSISFNADADQVYTIVLGGYRNGTWSDTNDGYALTVSQVPVPAAFWLMGSGLMGLMSMQRRKKAISV